MTRKEFFNRLKNLPRGWEAYVEKKFDGIDANGDNKFKEISIRIKDKNKTCYCPITAVCKIIKRKEYSLSEWPEAARVLGLREDTAENIAYGADYAFIYENHTKALKRVLGL